eukprot:gene19077-32207_t
MATAVPILHVVSVSSEAKGHDAKNVLDVKNGKATWQAEPGVKKAVLELQLERAVKVYEMMIGNGGAERVAVYVGNSTSPSGTPFESLLPSCKLASCADLQLGQTQSVKIVKNAELVMKTAEKRYDRVRLEVVTTSLGTRASPAAPIGLTFVEIFAPSEKNTAAALSPTAAAAAAAAPDLGAFKMKPKKDKRKLGVVGGGSMLFQSK